LALRKENNLINKALNYIVFAGPCTVAFLTVMIVPFVIGIYLSLSDWDGISNHYVFTGFQNYISSFDDKQFWNSFIITIKFVLFGVIFTNIIAFILALLLSKPMSGSNFYRASFFAPNLIGGIILGLIWRFIFNEGIPGIGQKLNLPAISTSFLSTPQRALWALIIVFVWQMSGYMMIIYIAGFMNIPKELIEAAEIDGATGFSKLKNIILPMVMPSFTVCIFLTLQRAFMTYDINIALTQGGPFNSTELVAMRVYNKAFISEQYGIGQAEAFILFLMVVIVTMFQVYFSKKAEVEV
jgi:raffinose/stachyose/melibiose transport system permease protein